jgi:hypothetical protein
MKMDVVPMTNSMRKIRGSGELLMRYRDFINAQ